MKISVIIPTKNRPQDLLKAVASIIAQNRLPDELILVDQSDSDASRPEIGEMMGNAGGSVRLNHIYDPRIRGLVDAKRVGALNASGDIVYFLEDDIILEPDYIEQIEQGFANHPKMVGCCGIITNSLPKPVGYEFIFHLFHRGIFRDIRVGLFGCFSGRGHPLIASDFLSGGMSAWRREVFFAVPFDVDSGFHMFEDIDFSTRVAKHFNSQLYINPNARLEHYWSPINRETLGASQRLKVRECIIYYNKRRSWKGATFGIYWLLIGLFLESSVKSASNFSCEMLWGYFLGIKDGCLA